MCEVNRQFCLSSWLILFLSACYFNPRPEACDLLICRTFQHPREKKNSRLIRHVQAARTQHQDIFQILHTARKRESAGAREVVFVSPRHFTDLTSIMDFRRTHQAFRERWEKTDNELCKNSMSFDLHNTLRQEFFASYLYLLEQIPLVKLYAVTCEYIMGEKQFYYRAQTFYRDVPASEEGMMGGFVEISAVDLEGSRQFLKKFVGPGKADTKRALDCGCGIGRVSKGVLFPVFESVEMLDMMEEFILHAHECYLGDYADRVETYYLDSLQDFTPPLDRYDVIWMQWIACHLTDKDLLGFLMRAKESLRPNGVIIIKDNMARQGCRLDPVDSSLIRHLDILKSIIQKAGLTILDLQKQEGFPDVIVPVWMIAMQ